jgi:hypothetical protein
LNRRPADNTTFAIRMIAFLDELVFQESLPGGGEGLGAARMVRCGRRSGRSCLQVAARHASPLLAGNQYIDAKNHSINFLNQFELTKLIFVKIREEMPRRLNAIAD